MNSKTDFFLGPCVLESQDLVLEVAAHLAQLQEKFSDRANLYFKGSFDKANRSSYDSYRGPGLEEGLKLLKMVKEKLKLKTITDFHLPEQAMTIAQEVDVLQVPAFLCRQTDLIASGAQACALHQRKLKIKKGQFLSPQEAQNIVEKAAHWLSKDHIMLTERGTSFGYNHLIVDMSSFQVMKSFGVKVIHDATHCVQRPGGRGSSTGGAKDQLLTLLKAATAAGADGFFLEVHPNPARALSDRETQISLDQIEMIISDTLQLKEAVQGLSMNQLELK